MVANFWIELGMSGIAQIQTTVHFEMDRQSLVEFLTEREKTVGVVCKRHGCHKLPDSIKVSLIEPAQRIKFSVNYFLCRLEVSADHPRINQRR